MQKQQKKSHNNYGSFSKVANNNTTMINHFVKTKILLEKMDAQMDCVIDSFNNYRMYHSTISKSESDILGKFTKVTSFQNKIIKYFGKNLMCLKCCLSTFVSYYHPLLSFVYPSYMLYLNVLIFSQFPLNCILIHCIIL